MSSRVKGSEGPVSSCLEDALQAALRSAFEVALEIAVNEISRLMGQALRDVRDQVHETQQENITLKLRLQQLRAEQDNTQPLAADPDQSRFRSDSLGEEHASSNVCEKQGSEEADAYVVNKAEMDCDGMNDSFHEIGDDGLLRSHEIPSSANDEKDTSDPENNLMSDHIHLEPSDPDSSSPCYFGCEEVEVNNEKPGPEEPVLDSNSACGSDPRPDFSFDQRSNEEFGLDKIALAQSKLLEDWRPDPEQTQRETEPLDQGSSLGTSEISLSSSGCVAPFDGLYQSADKTSLTQPPQNCRDQMKTNVQSSLHVCKFCGHAFHSGSDLRNHHCQHHKTILMRVGKDAFATRPNKQKQQLFPPGCSPYHCSVCNRDFNRLENLKTHLRIHTGERPYSCSVCGVRFRHAGALTRHFRIHTGEKPYICSECGKSFRNCGGLRFHQKSHSSAFHE